MPWKFSRRAQNLKSSTIREILKVTEQQMLFHLLAAYRHQIHFHYQKSKMQLMPYWKTRIFMVHYNMDQVKAIHLYGNG